VSHWRLTPANQSIKELKMAKQEKSTKTKRGLPMGAKAAIAAGAVGVGALLFGCDPEVNPTPKVCECPNGTFHDEGTSMPCCDGENCTCKVAFNVYLDTKQIRVEDRTGLANKADIQTALDNIYGIFSANAGVIHFKGMSTNPIMVIENIHNVRVDGNKFFIGMDSINADINNAIYEGITYIYNSSAPLMSKLSNKEIIEFGKRAMVPGTKLG
jgi:hypothetical protein